MSQWWGCGYPTHSWICSGYVVNAIEFHSINDAPEDAYEIKPLTTVGFGNRQISIERLKAGRLSIAGLRVLLLAL